MNTFLDLQATDLDIDLVLTLAPVGLPQARVTINNQVIHTGLLNQKLTIQHQLPLLKPFDIAVELLEKNYNAGHETAVIIEQFSIDNFNMVPGWTQLARYSNDHNYDQPTNYLGFVGSWLVEVDRPFYQWLHLMTNQGLLLNLNQ